MGIVAGEQEKLLEKSLFCSSSKLISHCSDCSRSTLTAHCINSDHVELFDDLGCQSNLLQMRQQKIHFYFSFFDSKLHIYISSETEESPVTYISLAFDRRIIQRYFLSILGSALCFPRAISNPFCFLQCSVKDIHQ